MAPIPYGEQAAFFRAALFLGLLKGERVVRWADAVIARDASAPAGFIEVAATSPEDLTTLRHALLTVCGEKESAAVVRALLGAAGRDLSAGRRSFKDTMIVLKQLRASIAVDRALNDRLKTLGVDVALAGAGTVLAAAAEQRVREWLGERERDADAFLEAR